MNDITKVQEIVQQLNIIDDTLFQKMAEDIGFCEEMLSTILDEKFPKVSARKKQFKESDGGTGEVCELVEQYGKECAERATEKTEQKAKQETIQTAKRFFQNGASYEMVRNSIPSLSDAELQGIYVESQSGLQSPPRN